jgi:hypothetical protein
MASLRYGKAVQCLGRMSRVLRACTVRPVGTGINGPTIVNFELLDWSARDGAIRAVDIGCRQLPKLGATRHPEIRV